MAQEIIVNKMLRGFPPHLQLTRKMNSAGPTFFSLHMEPVCNFRCRKCFHGEQKSLIQSHPILDLKEISKIIENAAAAGARSFGITGAGEPLLDKKLVQVITIANEFGLITHMATNSSMLTCKMAEFLLNNNVTLVLSLDTIDKAEFAELTRTKPEMFERVIRNIKIAQEVFQGTREILVVDGKEIEVFRIAVHMTVQNIKEGDVDRLKEIVLPDTMFSLSPLANIGWAEEAKPESVLEERMRQELSEKHITICKDPKSGIEICGLFKFGVDINFDGQLLLDSHAMETRSLFPNIRDFNFDVKRAFQHMQPIKEEFIRTHLDGFCAIRSSRFNEWVDGKKENLVREVNAKKIAESVRRNEPLLKFAFIGKGADRFLDIVKSEEYHSAGAENRIIETNKDAIKEFIGEKRIVALGVGDGTKLQRILDQKPGAVLVDISRRMLELSSEVIVLPETMEMDFDEIDFTVFGKDSLFVMLGNTLGNIEDMKGFLERIKKVPGSKIIVGIELLSDGQLEKDRIVREYDNETGFAFVFMPLETLGIARNQGKITVRFNEEKNRIEEFFEFSDEDARDEFAKKWGIEPQHTQRILLSISSKLRKQDFLDLVGDAGFIAEKIFNEGTNFVFLLSSRNRAEA